MLGLTIRPTASRAGSGFWDDLKRWFSKHYGYQPNRTYMRGPGPASGSTTAKKTETTENRT